MGKISNYCSLLVVLFMFIISSFAQEKGNSGDVHIGQGCIINPSATIDAGTGSIYIGDGNIVERNVNILNRHNRRLTIGQGNIFKSNCTVEALEVGNGNILGPNSYLGPQVTMGNGCIITPGKRVTGPKHIPDGSII